METKSSVKLSLYTTVYFTPLVLTKNELSRHEFDIKKIIIVRALQNLNIYD